MPVSTEYLEVVSVAQGLNELLRQVRTPEQRASADENIAVGEPLTAIAIALDFAAYKNVLIPPELLDRALVLADPAGIHPASITHLRELNTPAS